MAVTMAAGLPASVAWPFTGRTLEGSCSASINQRFDKREECSLQCGGDENFSETEFRLESFGAVLPVPGGGSLPDLFEYDTSESTAHHPADQSDGPIEDLC